MVGLTYLMINDLENLQPQRNVSHHVRRSNQQLGRLVQESIRLFQSRRMSYWWLVGLGAIVLAYLLFQPKLEQSLGVDLPGLGDDVSTQSPTTTQSDSSSVELEATADEVDRILRSSSREVFQSPAGLRYTAGSVHGHRLKHLMAHTQDQPDRPGRHGVFDATDPMEVVALVDEAYRQALAGEKTRVTQEDERTVYTVNLNRRIGYIGGESGNRRGRPAASQLRLVLDGKNFVTAFPYRPYSTKGE